MAFNFPDSPTAGTIFTDTASGAQYVYTNGVWMQSSAAQIKLTAQARSRVVNGAMQISQEWGNGSSGAVTAVNFFIADQWGAISSHSPGTLTGQRQQVTTPNGSINRLRLTVGTAKAALAAGDYALFQQKLEGIRTADFRWGTASAKPVILRFGVKAPAGTYSASLYNGAGNRAYVANFTIAAGQANTDTEQTILIPGDVTGVWPVDTALGMVVSFTFAAGTTSQGVTGWQTGAFISTAAASNGMAGAGNIFELFDVGLYLDDQATGAAPPWVLPDEAQELAACQRYWQKIYCMVNVNTNNYSISTIPFRSAPAITGGAAGFTVRVNDPNTFIVDQTTRGYQTLILTARM